jgi:hypothetical protein
MPDIRDRFERPVEGPIAPTERRIGREVFFALTNSTDLK